MGKQAFVKVQVSCHQSNYKKPPQILRYLLAIHRVGGGLAPSVLPHHRTYGSVCDFCSSGQRFVTPWRDFLQIPPHGGHPCRPANRSPCRAGRGLSPISHSTATTAVETALNKCYTPCLAHQQKRGILPQTRRNAPLIHQLFSRSTVRSPAIWRLAGGTCSILSWLCPLC